MKKPGMNWFAATALLFGVAASGQAASQQQDDDWLPPGSGFDLSLEFVAYGELASPVGDFSNHVNLGGGGGLAAILFPKASEQVGLRVDGSFVIYGSEVVTVPLIDAPLIAVDVRTTNSIVSLGAGPQLYLLTGQIRPYLFGTVGFAHFETESAAKGSDSSYSFANTTQHSDYSLSLVGGGGLSVQVARQLSLDISAMYRHNGLTEYLTKESIEKNPRLATAEYIETDANLVSFQLGVSFSLPSSR